MLLDVVCLGLLEWKMWLFVKWGIKGVDDWENNGEVMGVVFVWLIILLFIFGNCIWVDVWDNINWDVEEGFVVCFMVFSVFWIVKGL